MKKLTPKQQAVMDALERAHGPLTPLEIANAAGVNANTVKGYVRQFEKDGLIQGNRSGAYELVRNGRTRLQPRAPLLSPEEQAMLVPLIDELGGGDVRVFVDVIRRAMKSSEAGPTTGTSLGIDEKLLRAEGSEYAGSVEPARAPAATGETLLVRVTFEVPGYEIPMDVVARGRGTEIKLPAGIRAEPPGRGPEKRK